MINCRRRMIYLVPMQILLWVLFAAVVMILLAVDLFIVNRTSREMRRGEALMWSCIWILVSLIFCGGVWLAEGADKGAMFLTGYLIEKSLSLDNLFVILMIFTYFGIRPRHQRRILSWGIIGALLMRAVFIFAGLALVHALHWIIYVFGAFLVLTGVRMFFPAKEEIHPENNWGLKLFKRFFPTSLKATGQRFFILRRGLASRRRLVATPLFVALLVIETSDLMFAIDSIPAILAVSTDPFIVYSSNIFAVLGLRALYFLLAGWMASLRFLKPSLAMILTFLGLKMVLSGVLSVSVHVSLAVVFGILAAGGLLSWAFPLAKDSNPS
jgi:tellurite resistance protein TerC